MDTKDIAAQITKDILISIINKGYLGGDISILNTAYKEIFATVNSCCEEESAHKKRDPLSVI